MNSTASPLFDNVNLVSLNNDILLYDASSFFLGKMFESNGIAEDIVFFCCCRHLEPALAVTTMLNVMTTSKGVELGQPLVQLIQATV